jgi:hypothetical protein
MFMKNFRTIFAFVLLVTGTSFSFTVDSLFEPIIRSFDLLPDYYTRFDLSTFALHRDAFFKRQYLAEPHPTLEFCFLSYKNLIASVWQADFQFGLGQLPGNNVFTVLNVAFGIDPMVELRLRDFRITGGLSHHCYHEIDRSDFPIVYDNKLFLLTASPNSRLNDYFHMITADPSFSQKKRFAWQAEAGYFLREFFGLASPDKLNGNNPLLWEAATTCRYAFHRRLSWIFAARGESTVGTFSQTGGYHVSSGSNWYWKQAVGGEAYFIRGTRGFCLYLLYHLDDLPAAPNAPSFTLGNSRFSKNGLAQIGITFFN